MNQPPVINKTTKAHQQRTGTLPKAGPIQRGHSGLAKGQPVGKQTGFIAKPVLSKAKAFALDTLIQKQKDTILRYVKGLFPMQYRKQYGQKRLFALFLMTAESTAIIATLPAAEANTLLAIITKFGQTPQERLDWLAAKLSAAQYNHAEMWLTSLRKAEQVIHKL